MSEANNLKSHYDFFLSYGSRQRMIGDIARKIILENGFTVFDPSVIRMGLYLDNIVNQIRSCDATILFIDGHFIHSDMRKMEAMEALKCARDYDRRIIILAEENALPSLPLELSTFQTYVYDSFDSFESLLKNVLSGYQKTNERASLYDKLSQYIEIEHTEKIALTIIQLIDLALAKIEEKIPFIKSKKQVDIYLELTNLLQTLGKHFQCGFSASEKELAKKVGQSLERMTKATGLEKVDKNNESSLIGTSFGLSMLTLVSNIRFEIIEILSNGDGDPKPSQSVVEAFETLKSLYSSLYTPFIDKQYPEPIVSLIEEAGNLCKTPLFTKKYAEKEIRDTNKTELETKLFEIAKSYDETNGLFESLLVNEKETSEYLNCLKTSYERLKNFSEIVNCKNVCATCIDRISEINGRLAKLPENEIEEGLKETSFKALLGFSLPKDSTFDVFISHKSEDNDLAKNVYHFVKNNLLNPFYDKVTLPRLGKSEYREAIMDSLDRSRNFVVVLSKLEYLKANWVELEMKTFWSELSEGRKEDANFILIVTPDLFQQIKESNKKCLPIQYRGSEIMTTTDYRDRLISYLKK